MNTDEENASIRSDGEARLSAASAGEASDGFGARCFLYAKWLICATIAGGAIGLVSYFVWFASAPVFRPTVLFEVSPPVRNATETPEVMSGQEEINRFMSTQKTRMTSDGVLMRVATSPELQNKAKNWSSRFTEKGAFNSQEALEELRDIVDARIVTGTMLIELSATYSDKVEATDIVKLVKDKYVDFISEQGRRTRDNRTQSLREGIDLVQQQIDQRVSELETLFRSNNVHMPIDALNAMLNTEIVEIATELVKCESKLASLEATRTRAAADSEKDADVRYSDELHERVNRSCRLTAIRSEIARLQGLQEAILESGRPASDGDFQLFESQIKEFEQTFRAKREELLLRGFESELTNLDSEILATEADRLRLLTAKADLQTRGIALNALKTRVSAIELAIEHLSASMLESQKAIRDVRMLDSLDDANRVTVAQDAFVPVEVESPRLSFHTTAGWALTTFPTILGISVREIRRRRSMKRK